MSYGRPSVFLNSGSPPTSTPAARILDKQKEYDLFLRFDAATQQLNESFDKLAGEFVELKGGTAAVSQVVEHWQSVFRAIHIALASMPDSEAEGGRSQPERLVRIPAAAPPSTETSNGASTGPQS